MFSKSDQRLAFNKLHRQKEFARLRKPTVDQFGYVRVIQRGEDLAFAAKVPLQFSIGETLPDDLQSHLLFEFTICACGQESRAHAATSNFTQDDVRAEAFAEIF